jgi:hypothetical protein
MLPLHQHVAFASHRVESGVVTDEIEWLYEYLQFFDTNMPTALNF